MSEQFDVIVIGSGPAGASAAYQLAHIGLKTLILEKESLPRYKSCGGGLTSKLSSIIDFELAPVVEETITRVELAYKHRSLLDVSFRRPIGWCVMRDTFDYYLVQRAVVAGATLHDAEPVKQITLTPGQVSVKTSLGDYRAEVVVGADGANGLTARAAGLHPTDTQAVALEMEMALPSEQSQAWKQTFYFDFDPQAIPRGGAWIFPKRNHVSVGVGLLLRQRTPQQGKEQTTSLRRMLKRWIDGEPTLRDHQVLLTRGHLLPLRTRDTPLQQQRVVLVGDAAGLIHPITGEGIYYAIRSGQIAAEVIQDAFSRHDYALTSYTPRINREFDPQFRGYDGLLRLVHPLRPVFKVALRHHVAGASSEARNRPIQLHLTQRGATRHPLSRALGGGIWKTLKGIGRLIEHS